MKKTSLLTILLLFVTLTPTVLAETSSKAKVSTPPGLLNKEQKPVNTGSRGQSIKEDKSGQSDKSMDIKNRLATPAGSLKKSHRQIIGKVAALGSSSLTIQSNGGATIIVSVDTNTKYFDWKGPKKGTTFASLKVGDRLSVVGVAPGETSGLAIIIYRLVEPARHAALFGTISAINMATPSATSSANLLNKKAKPSSTPLNQATVTLKLRLGTSSAVLINGDTKFKITGQKDATLNDLKIGQKVVTTGILDSLNNLVAKNFIVIANGKVPGNNGSATGSAQQASKSAKTNR